MSADEKVERISKLIDTYDKADQISKVLDKNYNDSSNEMRNLIENVRKILEDES